MKEQFWQILSVFLTCQPLLLTDWLRPDFNRASWIIDLTVWTGVEWSGEVWWDNCVTVRPLSRQSHDTLGYTGLDWQQPPTAGAPSSSSFSSSSSSFYQLRHHWHCPPHLVWSHRLSSPTTTPDIYIEQLLDFNKLTCLHPPVRLLIIEFFKNICQWNMTWQWSMMLMLTWYFYHHHTTVSLVIVWLSTSTMISLWYPHTPGRPITPVTSHHYPLHRIVLQWSGGGILTGDSPWPALT